jgi:hypothetical protein
MLYEKTPLTIYLMGVYVTSRFCIGNDALTHMLTGEGFIKTLSSAIILFLTTKEVKNE